MIFDWSEENVERLKTLWALGWTASQVAAELKGGVTRSAICGKINRLGLSHSRPHVRATQSLSNVSRRTLARRKAKLDPTPKTPRVRVNPANFERSRVSRANDPGTRALPAPAVVVDASLAKPWTERRFGECAYPIAGEGADTFSCCHPAQPNGYCAAHWSRMCNPVQPKKRDTNRLARWAA